MYKREVNNSSSEGKAKPTKSKESKSRMRLTFPLRLHRLLSHTKELGVDDIISWDPSGTKFIIYKQHDFVSKILPNMFKQSKFASFRRQLNAYGFDRELNLSANQQNTISEDAMTYVVYSRDHFRRDDPASCVKITRRRPNQNLMEGLSRLCPNANADVVTNSIMPPNVEEVKRQYPNASTLSKNPTLHLNNLPTLYKSSDTSTPSTERKGYSNDETASLRQKEMQQLLELLPHRLSNTVPGFSNLPNMPFLPAGFLQRERLANHTPLPPKKKTDEVMFDSMLDELAEGMKSTQEQANLRSVDPNLVWDPTRESLFQG